MEKSVAKTYLNVPLNCLKISTVMDDTVDVSVHVSLQFSDRNRLIEKIHL